ncbi:retrotransposon ORF1 [Tanacetum coccineum]
MENLYSKHGLVSRTYYEKSLIMVSTYGFKCGRLRKLRPDEAWATIERLAQYEDEGWNDTLTLDEVSLNFKNPDIKQLLGIMERKVDALMTDAVLLMGKGESVFRLTTNEIYRPPSKPLRREEFKHIVTNFILNQEERIVQFKNYMQVIVEEFMKFSSKVARRLKQRIKENENKPRKIEKITKYPDTKEEKGNLGNINSNPHPQPDPLASIATEQVRKMNSMLESLGLVPQSSNTKFVCSKEDDGELNLRENANGGISNFIGRIKGMHVFVGNFTYVIDFMIVEDISSIIDPRLSQVVLGRPFIEISNMTHDLPEGVVRFTNENDEVAYKMPHKIEQYNSLSNLEKEHTKSVYLRNEEDKRRGVDYVMSKILGFYKECLELGPEYVTGLDDEGEVT